MLMFYLVTLLKTLVSSRSFLLKIFGSFICIISHLQMGPLISFPVVSLLFLSHLSSLAVFKRGNSLQCKENLVYVGAVGM